VTPQEFVGALKITVHDSSIHNTLTVLNEGPAGRGPAKRLTELSEWFHSLSADDRTRLRQVVGLAVHASLFGILCVLDGVQVIDDGGRTRLELHAVVGGDATHLNPSTGEMLHDIYQADVYTDVFGGAAA